MALYANTGAGSHQEKARQTLFCHTRLGIDPFAACIYHERAVICSPMLPWWRHFQVGEHVDRPARPKVVSKRAALFARRTLHKFHDPFDPRNLHVAVIRKGRPQLSVVMTGSDRNMRVCHTRARGRNANQGKREEKAEFHKEARRTRRPAG